MTRSSSPLPQRITLIWGSDRVEVHDADWISKIVQELTEGEQMSDTAGLGLVEPRSRRQEEMAARFQSLGLPSLGDPRDAERTTGYQIPEQQWPVAVSALKVFLGIELPVALSFVSWLGRSEHRMSVVQAAFSKSWSYQWQGELKICWVLNGYQLYGDHQIGSPLIRPRRTQDSMSGHIERRLLSGKWVRWGFDGQSTPPTGYVWSSNERTFLFDANGIQRLGQSDADLMPVFERSETEDYDDDEDPQTKGAI